MSAECCKKFFYHFLISCTSELFDRSFFKFLCTQFINSELQINDSFSIIFIFIEDLVAYFIVDDHERASHFNSPPLLNISSVCAWNWNSISVVNEIRKTTLYSVRVMYEMFSWFVRTKKKSLLWYNISLHPYASILHHHRLDKSFSLFEQF